MIVSTLLWDANDHSAGFSRCYDESWVEKLYWGFRRNLTMPFEFVLFTDRGRDLPGAINQCAITDRVPTYASCIQPYVLGQPMILVGLDTMVVGNIDHLAQYCLRDQAIALPRDPNYPDIACNGVALVPGGNQHVANNHQGENDMEWMRAQPHRFIDDLFPGEVLSYKNHVAPTGQYLPPAAKIVYFHGERKAHQEGRRAPWIAQHWRIGE